MKIFNISKLASIAVPLLFSAAVTAADSSMGIAGKTFDVVYKNKRLQVCGKDGKAIFGLGNIYLFHTPFYAEPVRAEKTDDSALRIVYRTEKDSSGKILAESICRIDGDRIRMDYRLNIPQERRKNIGGITQEFLPYHKSRIGGVFKNGIWTRAPHGGVPYEKRGVYMKTVHGEKMMFAMPIPGNHYYSQGRRCAMPLKSGPDDCLQASLEITAFENRKEFEAAAYFDEQPFALKLSTEKRFNIFESGAPEIILEISRAKSDAADSGTLAVKAFDHDGTQVLNETKTLAFAPGERKTLRFRLPADKRNIYFAEASIVKDGKECFTRTNAAILPPFRYAHPEKSRMGICTNYRVYDDPELVRLMNRIGVRRKRSGDNAKTTPLGITSFLHDNVKPSPYDPEKDYPKIVTFVNRLEKTKAPWFEFCNEWSGAGNARRNPEEKRLYADYYLGWLKALRAEIEKRKLDVKIMSVAIGGAGADTLFVQYLYDNGAWNLLDGIAFHPGRGNNVPDMDGSGWRYLGSIRNMRKKLDELGGKPLFLTEVYASTQPNNSWGDSYRHAGENVFLSMALAYAENVETAFMFKFNEGISFDVNGVNENDREWNFGIMMRDGSPKPSMMGYAAAAEVLDGAEFIRYLSIPGTKIRGMEFRTPKGKMAILYDRKDGYWYEPKSDVFAHKEAWIDPWKSRTEYTFASRSGQIRLVDHIGREKTLPVKNGKVRLTLSGAPVAVYGLEL